MATQSRQRCQAMNFVVVKFPRKKIETEEEWIQKCTWAWVLCCMLAQAVTLLTPVLWSSPGRNTTNRPAATTSDWPCVYQADDSYIHTLASAVLKVTVKDTILNENLHSFPHHQICRSGAMRQRGNDEGNDEIMMRFVAEVLMKVCLLQRLACYQRRTVLLRLDTVVRDML